jgi:adenylate cyclase class IV/ribosomal protein S18 acetylase RimI-like enzyme
MARNIEIKARLDDFDAMLARARELADSGPHELLQDDTFFHCPDGRLKLRAFSASEGELIFYRRADEAGPCESFYLITKTSEPQRLRAVLAAAWGEAGRVRKHRTLLLAGRTRIHLDRVEGLGEFLELEVVLSADEPAAQGQAEARRLLTLLGVADDALVGRAYVDLIAARRDGGTTVAGVVLRRFEPADGEAVVDLWRRCGLTRPWNDPRRDIARKLRVQPELFLVAQDASGIVGSVMAGYDGHRGWVNYLAVRPGMQGRGLGSSLMRRVEDELLARGCPKVNLQIRTSNAAVRAFYESIGYTVDDALSMGKRLIPDTPPPAPGRQ